MDPVRLSTRLSMEMESIDFGNRIKYVYNPLCYAASPFASYVRKFGEPPRDIILVGMNPGPWGMAQTGVPFGEVSMVRDWMGVDGHVGRPDREHPRRPVTGFECTRSEVSGSRLWGWAKGRYGTADNFFSRFFVANYCPLIFYGEDGRNVTPDKLQASCREKLFELCDRALKETVRYLSPSYVIGVGVFAYGRCVESLSGLDIKTGRISHPSPANPAANRGWAGVVERELSEIGITL